LEFAEAVLHAQQYMHASNIPEACTAQALDANTADIPVLLLLLLLAGCAVVEV
jgi:hypothetical protein